MELHRNLAECRIQFAGGEHLVDKGEEAELNVTEQQLADLLICNWKISNYSACPSIVCRPTRKSCTQTHLTYPDWCQCPTLRWCNRRQSGLARCAQPMQPNNCFGISSRPMPCLASPPIAHPRPNRTIPVSSIRGQNKWIYLFMPNQCQCQASTGVIKCVIRLSSLSRHPLTTTISFRRNTFR